MKILYYFCNSFSYVTTPINGRDSIITVSGSGEYDYLHFICIKKSLWKNEWLLSATSKSETQELLEIIESTAFATSSKQNKTETKHCISRMNRWIAAEVGSRFYQTGYQMQVLVKSFRISFWCDTGHPVAMVRRKWQGSLPHTHQHTNFTY